MQSCVLFSGGKDSALALWYAIHQAHDVACLLTMHPRRSDSWMFHHPGVQWTRLQAEAAGIPLVTAETSGIKEEELNELRDSISGITRSYGIDCLVSGAIASEYQKSRVERICDDVGVRAVAPLWHKDPARLIHEQVSMGFEFIVTACMALGLDQGWLGRLVDDLALKELEAVGRRYRLNLAFEGGEAETFVTDAPIFTKRIRVVEAQPVWEQDSGYLNIIRAELAEKERLMK